MCMKCMIEFESCTPDENINKLDVYIYTLKSAIYLMDVYVLFEQSVNQISEKEIKNEQRLTYDFHK